MSHCTPIKTYTREGRENGPTGPKNQNPRTPKKREGRGKEKVARKADSDGVITNPPSPSPSKNRGSKAEYDSSETILPKNKERNTQNPLLVNRLQGANRRVSITPREGGGATQTKSQRRSLSIREKKVALASYSAFMVRLHIDNQGALTSVFHIPV